MSTTADSEAGRSACSDCRYFEKRDHAGSAARQPQWSCIADYVPETTSHVCCYEPQDVGTHPGRPACRHFEASGNAASRLAGHDG